ncbi:hypothetical protein ['Paenibacillus yunnanensis' Narsing Rao et al. 2020]|uniref:hypothetical protein n=1 Tax=Paenibacillus tengchongensis TaxID=2608684 RepID=UPI0016521E08|nr:hypothetical protein [Paenibacillus tengchongensis]
MGLVLIAAIAVLIWGVFFSRSGTLYQKGILRALESSYQSKFIIVSEEGTNEDGFQVLKAAPANDHNLVFTVSRSNGTIDGGLPLRRQLNEDYKETAQMKYYPQLVKKHFGIDIEEVPMSIYRGIDSSREPSDENYIEVTRNNADSIASKSKAFFQEAESHRLNKLFFRYKDNLALPSQDNDAQQRFELLGFEYEVGEHWGKGFRPLTEEELKAELVERIGIQIADRVVYAFEAENPDWQRTFDLQFPANDLTKFEGYVVSHTITAEQRDEALAEIYEAYTRVLPFTAKLNGLQMTVIHLQYKTNIETETVTLQAADWGALDSLDDMKELFNHSQKTKNPR